MRLRVFRIGCRNCTRHCPSQDHLLSGSGRVSIASTSHNQSQIVIKHRSRPWVYAWARGSGSYHGTRQWSCLSPKSLDKRSQPNDKLKRPPAVAGIHVSRVERLHAWNGNFVESTTPCAACQIFSHCILTGTTRLFVPLLTKIYSSGRRGSSGERLHYDPY